MAKKVRKVVKKRTSAEQNSVEWNFPLEKKNLFILLGGLGVVILGFLAMSTGLGDEYALPDGNWNSTLAIVIGPMLLVIAYLIIIPYGILKTFDKSNNKQELKDEPAN